MYQWTATKFEPITFVVVCIALSIVGVKSRESSKWVVQRNTVLTSVFVLILLADGLLSFHFDAGEFLASEWLRIVLLIIAVHGLSAFILRCFEEILHGIVHPAQTFFRSREANKLRAVQEGERRREEERIAREYESQRPERERANRERAEQNRERAEQKRQEEEKRTLEQTRRDDARKQVLLVYHRHASDVAESMPWERFTDFMNRFMSDQVDAATVEKRGEELRDMILSFFRSSPFNRSAPQSSLAEISEVFEKRRSEVQLMPCDEAAREAQLAHLAIEEARAIRKYHST